MDGTRGEPGRVPVADSRLGCTPRYVDGRVFVTKVLPESQAEVDEVVLAGDILDEINGCSLRYASPGQAGAMLQRLKGQPLTFRLLRWRWHDGTIFEPLLPYLKALKEKEPHFQLQHSPQHRGEGEPQQLQGGRLLYNLQYLGQTSVGTYGGKEVLEGAIPAVLERDLAAQEVLFDVKEAEVLVQEKASSKLLCRHPYPSISCVGRCTWSPRIFAFCVVSSPETPDGSTFDCLVFASSSEQECEEIVGRIELTTKHHKNSLHLSPLSPYPASQLDIFGHDGDSLGMDGTQVCVFKQTHQICLAGLLFQEHKKKR
ncbi:hypothetical protein IHE44_0006804 [Lamprotornis superbus]|uniref:PDZ domain-containing protein n=1 Tax=Lamprotornis superbus TaxID=245042 RepID=A0A835NHD7_9PASS|nr:hypothetical protein IHE44_0006804 [Lamprotornis superbus]